MTLPGRSSSRSLDAIQRARKSRDPSRRRRRRSRLPANLSPPCGCAQPARRRCVEEAAYCFKPVFKGAEKDWVAKRSVPAMPLCRGRSTSGLVRRLMQSR